MSQPYVYRPQLKAGHVSDPGLVRSRNEDAILADPDRGLLLVVDGVGGQAGGDRAAALAVETISRVLEEERGDPAEQVERAILEANNAIYEESRQDARFAGMACVLTLVLVEGRLAVVGHVGDTRLYRVRGQRMEKLTRDHSPVGEREDRNEISEAEAMGHPRRNEVFRDVGSQRRDSAAGWADVFLTTFPADSALLLCSDGLTDLVPRAQMLGVISRYAGDAAGVARDLVEAANLAGGKDNVSVIFAPGPDFSPAARSASDGAITRPLASGSAGERNGESASAGSAVPRKATKSGPWRALVALAGGIALGAAGTFWLGNDVDSSGFTAPSVYTVAEGDSLVAALEKARPGDVVRVGPGRYAGPVALKSGVRLEARPAWRAEIFLNQPGPEALIFATNVEEAEVDGFQLSITPGRGTPYGLAIVDSTVTASGLGIRNAGEAAVDVRGTSSFMLTDSLLAAQTGLAVRLRGVAEGTIAGNRIEGNGAGIRIEDQARAVVERNLFFNQPQPLTGNIAVEEVLRRNVVVGPPAAPVAGPAARPPAARRRP